MYGVRRQDGHVLPVRYPCILPSTVPYAAEGTLVEFVFVIDWLSIRLQTRQLDTTHDQDTYRYT